MECRILSGPAGILLSNKILGMEKSHFFNRRLQFPKILKYAHHLLTYQRHLYIGQLLLSTSRRKLQLNWDSEQGVCSSCVASRMQSFRYVHRKQAGTRNGMDVQLAQDVDDWLLL